MKTFTESLRYDYPELRPESIVFDVGYHKGTFSKLILEKHPCQIHAFEPVEEFRGSPSSSSISLHPFAIGGSTRLDQFKIKGDMTGLYSEGTSIPISVESITDFRVRNRIESVSLLKLNCEGMEYEILEQILLHDHPRQYHNIQVQFHPVFKDSSQRYVKIRERLLQTHDLTFCEPFIWENYRVNTTPSAFKENLQSQAGQDRFVHALLPEPSAFLDIGCGSPTTLSNTYALWKSGWKGIAIDNSQEADSAWKASERSPFWLADATNLDWALIKTNLGRRIGYLSLDVDGASLQCLRTIPLNDIRFNAITIEHDAYRFGDGPKNEMRSILCAHGYELLCPDISDQWMPFEDWWIDPLQFPETILRGFRQTKTSEWKSLFL
jgi:FkbM family methyltransferase